MINKNILSTFESHQKDPSFSIIIDSIEQKEDCNQESLIITAYQINKSISELSTGNMYKKKLHIVSELNIDDDNLYKTKLVGYVSNEGVVENIEAPNEILSHNIEVLDTKLQKEIEIEFNKEYIETPKIVVNIDEKYEHLYKDYFTNFTETTNGLYNGVKLVFNSLKTRKIYPKIGIIIIGDKIDNEQTETDTDNSE